MPEPCTAQQFIDWGTAGGKARAAKLSARRRRQIARKAALARWAKKKENVSPT